MATIAHAAIINKIDPRIYRFPQLMAQKDRKEYHIDSYIFETIVAKFHTLEARIDELENR